MKPNRFSFIFGQITWELSFQVSSHFLGLVPVALVVSSVKSCSSQLKKLMHHLNLYTPSAMLEYRQDTLVNALNNFIFVSSDHMVPVLSRLLFRKPLPGLLAHPHQRRTSELTALQTHSDNPLPSSLLLQPISICSHVGSIIHMTTVVMFWDEPRLWDFCAELWRGIIVSKLASCRGGAKI